MKEERQGGLGSCLFKVIKGTDLPSQHNRVKDAKKSVFQVLFF